MLIPVESTRTNREGVMSETIKQELFAAELMEILEEVFDTHHGVLLDEGTSLYATLGGITAEEASAAIAEETVSIAAHVEHVIFYLDVLGRHIAGDEIGELDWSEIWERVGVVTKAEWDDLRGRLQAKYRWLVEILEGIDDWQTNDAVGASIAILAHTACHLGVIRQAVTGIRRS